MAARRPTISRPKYQYSGLTRTEAENLLLESDTNGAFLVRDSESVAGASVLSVCNDRRIQHYRIMSDASGVKMEGLPKTFPSLQELIAYCRTTDTLGTVKLRQPIEHVQQAEVEEEPAPSDEQVADDEIDGLCATSFLLREAFDALESKHVDDLRMFSRYINECACADSEAAKKPTGAEQFRQMLVEMAAPVVKELNILSNKLQRIRSVFLSAGGFEPTDVHAAAGGSTWEATIASMQVARELLRDTERQADRYLRDMTCEHSSSPLAAAPTALPAASKGSLTRGIRLFDVKRVEKRVTTVRTTLMVDAVNHSVAVGRGSGVSEDDRTYPASQILQLIKSRSDKTKLGIRFDARKRKDYLFQDAQAREEFCQAVQMMKNQEEEPDQFEKLSLFVGTFNMGEAAPPASLTSWLTSQGEGMTLNLSEASHDLYVIGTQESALSEKEWAAIIKRHLGDNYSMVASEQLWQIRIVLFARASLLTKISHVQTATVATGIANALGNKGAVGVSLCIGTTTLCFINCHLAAGAEKWARRRANYSDILTKLQLGQKRLVGFDVSTQFHHLFWMGDMNYRLNFPIKTILENISQHNWPFLRKADQLIRSRKAFEVFCGFDEGEINFPPTYRYERGTRDSYKWNKQKATHVKINVPSWCDRVLWKTFPNMYALQTSYGCPTDIMTSDHSPVFATFTLEIANQYVSRIGAGDVGHAPCQIIINRCEARLLSASKSRFYLEFFASYIQDSVRTSVNSRFANDDQPTPSKDGSSPLWEDVELPVLRPIIPDQQYLEKEHLLVAVRSQDSDESYGVAIIGLMYVFGDNPVPFSCKLFHRGEFAGELMGYMHVVNSIGQAKAQSIIRAEDDDYFRLTTSDDGPARPSSRVLDASSDQPTSAASRPAPTVTVGAWLESLGLAALAPKFIENGFDDMKFLQDIEPADLRSIGVEDPAAQGTILAAIRRL